MAGREKRETLVAVLPGIQPQSLLAFQLYLPIFIIWALSLAYIPMGTPLILLTNKPKTNYFALSGYYACDFVGGTAKYLGSLGHETSDANSFASWGADYLKVNNNNPIRNCQF